MRMCILVGVCLTLQVLIARADSDVEWWGVFGGWSLLDHRASIPVYDGQPECGEFTRGRSSGILFGVSYDRSVLPWIEGSLRATLWHRPARLELVTDNGLEAYDPAQGAYVPYLRRHVWNATLRYLGLELSGRIYPLRAIGLEIPFWLRVGGDVSHPAFGADYEQTEEIIQPAALLFPDGTRRHTIASGAIPDAATTFGVVTSVGATLPLRERIALMPELGIRYGLGSIRSTYQWTVHAAFAAVGIRVNWSTPPPEPLPPPPPPQPEEPTTPLQMLSLASPEPITVQEAVVTETFPLLPYVFFDSASSVIPPRYVPPIDPERFADSLLPRSTLGIYYHLLHILGKRLAADTTAVLLITGTTDGREVPPAEQRALARARAEATAGYLASCWHLRPSQLVVRTIPTPSIPTNPAYPEGLVENRRVELASEQQSVFAPIVHERFREYVVLRSRATLRTESTLPTAGWELEARYSNAILARRQGYGTLPSVLGIDLDTAALAALAPQIADRDSIECELRTETAEGRQLQSRVFLPIVRTTSKFERRRLSLVVFDFDRAELSPSNRALVQRFVAGAITPRSRVRITGTTDRLGEAAYNMQLSQARADETRRTIEAILPSVHIEEARGIGSSQLLFDNSLPEGRSYCRTVTIVVETPLDPSAPR
ncbi:MAG: OmpA family protein [Chlorobiota bacterium]|nr:MAG: OmpA family protein [Chlorobiota bacterium]